MAIHFKTEKELQLMREVGRVVAITLAELEQAVRPGITTAELDRIAENVIRKLGAVPAFKGYHGYPATICASVNEEVVHGIPGLRKLENGDIISIDVGAVLNGFYGDSARTFPVGDISADARRLLAVTEESLYQGISQAKVGNRISDISHAVQKYVESHGFSVVRDYVGHGIGTAMHEEPQVPNFGPPGRGHRLLPGMTLAIEPMVNMGEYHVKTLADGWTVVTLDGSLSAHFEHTIAITADGPEILTKV
ncbi:MULTISPECIES: type I methionyl aminopeptidase [Carboxydocella]|uniref:Methionine aminopeptidase n=3 Tax=Carboxydocella TaxID=178898 RepID=A0A1T4SA55_9FIRM|nr:MULTISPECIES: type I methionyl aminopeptidase [Carboxydocella]AVX21786.1 methionine aminopeptidase, type I [Carboxydocella thermautotrophica]AVX32190.1 methionine aminopeptidase, type I [Carboxydocella thermautotrophica]SKA25067.1 methionine aminopeptidase, type I [Carboxydocella sporoproducens DSM 16521]GAW27582.1 methionine aminopeptidase, type I [Carboxydocella sp. ULO1]GAW30910.1 methionine aminopeptidase, type I [Carboxydocella sp. JDF658]